MSWSEELPELPGIYKLTNLVNGKFYIGQSHNIKGRVSGHKYNKSKVIGTAIKKYGWANFKKQAIEVFPLNTSEEVLLYRETFWIKFLKAHAKYGNYNLKEDTIDYRREEYKKKRREQKFKDKEPVPQKEKRERTTCETYPDAANRKPIKQIDMLTGETIKVWPSIKMAAQHIGGSSTAIVRVAKKQYGSKSHRGFYWEYDTLAEVSRKSPEKICQKIKEAIKGKRGGANNGMFGKKHSEETRKKISNKRTRKSVAQIDKDTGEVIRIWDSIADAGRALSKTGNKSPISFCINQTRSGCKTAFGYKWERVEE